MRCASWCMGTVSYIIWCAILAGTLVGVGEGKLAGGAIRRAIESGDRLALGMTAPAHGLTLMKVFYGDDDEAGDYFEQWI